MGATNTLDRVAASVGLLMRVDIRFEVANDVSNGGVLLALPALLACGLLRNAQKYFNLPRGFYRLESIFLLLAFMALARLKSTESLRYVPPGEWGKLLGLDRIPEARTLRNKLKLLVKQDAAAWSAELCTEWMQNDPKSCGTFYVDGHVRVYYGTQTKLPRHYVSRERLCLRAITDYWVNAMDGCPFFYVTKEIDPGLLHVLENDIVPRIENTLPMAEEFSGKPGSLTAPRCTLIYDREGYSPGFMQRMRERGIACVSYHKHPGMPWSEDEFHRQTVALVSGEVVEMELAERGVQVGVAKVWMREVRRRTKSGHQTSVLSTHDGLAEHQIAASMFARWSQENFFRYMREHYGLDRLADYCLEEIPATTRVVNPDHRQIDGQVRKRVGELNKKLAEFGALRLDGEIEPENVDTYERKKTDLHQQVMDLQQQVGALKQQRKETPRHITVSELSEEHRFKVTSAWRGPRQISSASVGWLSQTQPPARSQHHGKSSTTVIQSIESPKPKRRRKCRPQHQAAGTAIREVPPRPSVADTGPRQPSCRRVGRRTTGDDTSSATALLRIIPEPTRILAEERDRESDVRRGGSAGATDFLRRRGGTDANC